MANDNKSSEKADIKPAPDYKSPFTTTSTGSPSSRRRSSLFKPLNTLSEDDDEFPEPMYECVTVPLDPALVTAITPLGAHNGLRTAIKESNEALDEALLTWVYDTNEAEKTNAVNSGTAVNYKFEELRARILASIAEFEEACDDRDTAKAEARKLKKQLDDSQQENLRLTKSIITMRNRKADTYRDSFDFSGWDSTTVDITVPKQYRTQLQATGLTAYEGGSDVEAIFKYIKTLNHHVRVLRGFSDIQKIEYAISYMAGSVHRWATDTWMKATREEDKTWDNFITAFKQEWVPVNANLHLTTKLERMDMKAYEINQFNDRYRAILELMDYDELTELKEENQYFKIYYRKIRDPHIIAALTTATLTNADGLNLDTLMKSTARLMAIRPQPEKSTSTTSKKPAHLKGKKVHKPTVNNVEASDAEDDSDTEEINAVSSSNTQQSSNRGGSNNRGRGGWNRGGGYRGGFNTNRTYNCHLCNDGEHFWADCPLKKQVLEMVKKCSQSQAKKEEKTEKAGKA
ncbi:hypothetical protein BJ508DRAFT_303830 [Ascobolus immersus RN42]|uniref:Ty3 transposon capsid-like protein domain-containing protein n=1 Tax=Ascobolus immersus RN42 TaxID=1160509 RepID=A0A3N4IRW6_ASCIM|nr:hypothetical protein BJ508DRAFT_303830 [Ascobolus immersus RN42]